MVQSLVPAAALLILAGGLKSPYLAPPSLLTLGDDSHWGPGLTKVSGKADYPNRGSHGAPVLLCPMLGLDTWG